MIEYRSILFKGIFILLIFLFSYSNSYSALDTVVVYSAKDTVHFNFKSKRMRLNGESMLDLNKQSLESETIVIDFETNFLEAYGAVDSTGIRFGFPKFTEGSEVFFGESIKYNYQTNKGLIKQGETNLDEGFYYGNKIKRISTDEFNIRDGFYTPCDEDDPSIYFGSEKMQMVNQDKVFIDPLIVYLQDMPVFMYPFGIFFSTQKGRRSGFIVPTFDFSQQRGVVFQDFGFYWAASDKWDTQFTADYFSKGGYLVKNTSIFKYQDRFRANMNLQYGKTRNSPDVPYVENYRVFLNSDLQISPNQRLTSNINYSTQDFNRRTTGVLNQRIKQDITSNASYSVNLGQYGNLSAAYNRTQNIINNTHFQNPSVRFSLPNKKLGKMFGQDIVASYGLNANYTERKDLAFADVLNDQDSLLFVDTSFAYSSNSSIRHSPGVSVNLPQIFNFRIQPRIGIGWNNFFRRVKKEYDPDNDQVVETFTQGFYNEAFINGGFRINTRLYGVSAPNFWGIKALRHVIEPEINYSFTPDFSSLYYDEYIDTSGTVFKYNVFERDGGASPARSSQRLDYAVNQKWQMKYSKNDSLDPIDLELLNLRFNGSYDFNAPEFKFTDPNISFTTPALKFVNLNGSAGLSYYDLDPVLDTNSVIIDYDKVNSTLFSRRKFPARFRSFNLSISTSFSDKGISLEDDVISQETMMDQDSLEARNALGGRFLRRMNRRQEKFDTFGDSSPGYRPLSIPWNISLGLVYSINSITPIDAVENLTTNANLNVTIAESWDIQMSAQYDVIRKELSTPRMSLIKDIKCWQMQFNWVPAGPHRSFYFSIGLNAAQLRDLRYEKRSTAFY